MQTMTPRRPLPDRKPGQTYFRPKEPISGSLVALAVVALFVFDVVAVGYMFVNAWQIWGPK